MGHSSSETGTASQSTANGSRILVGTGIWVLNGWIRDWMIRDWMILDCRHTMPKPFTAVPGAKLWRVVFTTDYKSATVLDAANNVVMENFVLLN